MTKLMEKCGLTGEELRNNAGAAVVRRSKKRGKTRAQDREEVAQEACLLFLEKERDGKFDPQKGSPVTFIDLCARAALRDGLVRREEKEQKVLVALRNRPPQRGSLMVAFEYAAAEAYGVPPERAFDEALLRVRAGLTRQQRSALDVLLSGDKRSKSGLTDGGWWRACMQIRRAFRRAIREALNGSYLLQVIEAPD